MKEIYETFRYGYRYWKIAGNKRLFSTKVEAERFLKMSPEQRQLRGYFGPGTTSDTGKG